LPTERIKRAQRGSPASLSTRLAPGVALEAHASGDIVTRFHGHSFRVGKFSARTADRVQDLRSGLPFSSVVASTDKELYVLVRRLAAQGLVEYRLGRKGEDLVVIEPQVSDYWPPTMTIRDRDTLVLSRFAYMRRRGNEMILESPRSGAVFKICNPKIANGLAKLCTPHQFKRMRQEYPSFASQLVAILVDCDILLKLKNAKDSVSRAAEGDDNLVLWDFHDLLFHARSTEGRHANPLGGIYPYARAVSSPPAIRPSWPGKKIVLRRFSVVQPESISTYERLLRQRHSTRNFDDQRPITLEELSRFLDGTAPVVCQGTSKTGFGTDTPPITYAPRPYPSAGASYELELYLAVNKCEGLSRGFYHYDAGEHALVRIEVLDRQLEAVLMRAGSAMGAPAAPQVLITIAARFARVSWKYSAIAYELILKDVGVLMQTFYLMITEMKLGGCAIGITNIDLFEKMTGIPFHVEGPVGHFAIGHSMPRPVL
jgi:SagB-type dehydrogenase family enzyme